MSCFCAIDLLIYVSFIAGFIHLATSLYNGLRHLIYYATRKMDNLYQIYGI